MYCYAIMVSFRVIANTLTNIFLMTQSLNSIITNLSNMTGFGFQYFYD